MREILDGTYEVTKLLVTKKFLLDEGALVRVKEVLSGSAVKDGQPTSEVSFSTHNLNSSFEMTFGRTYAMGLIRQYLKRREIE